VYTIIFPELFLKVELIKWLCFTGMSLPNIYKTAETWCWLSKLTFFVSLLTLHVNAMTTYFPNRLPIKCSIICTHHLPTESCDSSISIALGYRLDDWGSRVRFPVGAGNFSLHHHVQKSSGAHPASYLMGTRGSFPEDKAARA
jgi:hypothetical protein